MRDRSPEQVANDLVECHGSWVSMARAVARAIREAVEAEREACAALVDAVPRPTDEQIEITHPEHQSCAWGERLALERLAAAIRARGEHK